MNSSPKDAVSEDRRSWAFLLRGPRGTLDCIPLSTPWWSIDFVEHDCEVWIPGKHKESDGGAQVELAKSVLTQMNGLAVSHGQAGLLEIDMFVAYTESGSRSLHIPLSFAITRTELGSLWGSARIDIPSQRISVKDQLRLGELLALWGQKNAETYEGLAKIFDWIEGVDSELVKKQVSGAKKSVLMRTCNHPSSGPTARHPRSREEAPPKPMMLSEIRAIVRKLSMSYMESIGARSTASRWPET